MRMGARMGARMRMGATPFIFAMTSFFERFHLV
jgi:hypothetical protein